MSESSNAPGPPVHRLVDKAAAYSWRLIVIGVVVVACLWVVRQARVVFFPIVIALFLARVLSPVSALLRRHRWRPGLAAVASMVAFFVIIGALLALAIGSFANEMESIGPTLTQAVDDIEEWLVNDSPVDL